MGAATATRVRTVTRAAPTRPTMHADALLKFDFTGQNLRHAASGALPSVQEPERSIKDAIIHWLEQQL